MKLKIKRFGLLNRLREQQTQTTKREYTELLPWDDMIEEFENEGTYNYLKFTSPKARIQLVRVSTDLVDYFIDTANVTDKVEMGGFLMGVSKDVYRQIAGILRSYVLIQYFDFVTCRNVAGNIEQSYEPEPSCYDEVRESILEDMKYGPDSDYTIIHTHPDGSSVSPGDLIGYLEDVEEDIFMKRPPGLEMVIGDNDYVGTYSFYPHLVSYVGDESILTVGAFQFKTTYFDVMERYVNLLKKRGVDTKMARRYMEVLRITFVSVDGLRNIRPEVKL